MGHVCNLVSSPFLRTDASRALHATCTVQFAGCRRKLLGTEGLSIGSFCGKRGGTAKTASTTASDRRAPNLTRTLAKSRHLAISHGDTLAVFDDVRQSLAVGIPTYHSISRFHHQHDASAINAQKTQSSNRIIRRIFSTGAPGCDSGVALTVWWPHQPWPPPAYTLGHLRAACRSP
jgi:hypothetical protein